MTLSGGGQTQRPADLLWLLASLQGRISREPFWLGLLLLNLIVAIVLGTAIRHSHWQPAVSAVLPFVILPLMWSEIALIVKRAHDRGVTGFVAILSLVPFANIALVIFLGLVPGDPGPNTYGSRPNAPA